MTIPPAHLRKYAYHFTHVSNLDSIIRHGLLATNVKGSLDINHRNIALASIQSRRHEMEVPCGPGGTVHDYVPFYFCSVNPMMLSVLNARNVDQQDLVFLCVRIDVLLKEGTVFTDASANTNNPPNFFEHPSDLDRLNWELIYNVKWGGYTSEERHHRMAELLIHDHVDIEDIAHIIVWDEETRDLVLDVFEQNKVSPPEIGFDPFNGKHFYFKKFPPDNPWESLIAGPCFLKQTFEYVVKKIRLDRSEDGDEMIYSFDDIGRLLAALKNNFKTISEMANISGLEVKENNHTHIVSDRTVEAVETIKKDRFYKSCDAKDKQILLLAAYLHGIGKAPSDHSSGHPHRAPVDYPYNSLKKLMRVLTREIKKLSNYELRKICLLVGYHDLVGDIILDRRDKAQLFELIEDEKELDMLIAMARIGIDGTNVFEKPEVKKEVTKLRQQAVEQLAKK